jgi:hypothetical protein
MLFAVHQMLQRDCMKRVQPASNRQVQQNLPEAGNQLGIPATLWVFGCAVVLQQQSSIFIVAEGSKDSKNLHVATKQTMTHLVDRFQGSEQV